VNTSDYEFISSELRRRFSHVPIRKILLVNPPALTASEFDVAAARKRRYSAFMPYGPLVLATELRNADFEVSVLDLNFKVLNEIQCDEHLDIAAAWQYDLYQAITSFNPDVIGVTCMFTMTHGVFAEVVRKAKEFAKVPIIIGGVHVTNDTERILRGLDSADVAVTHEGDVSLRELLAFLNNPEDTQNLPRQIALLINDTVWTDTRRALPSADELSVIPAYDLIDAENYSTVGSVGSFNSLLPPGARVASVLSNRGCRAQCNFCSVRFFNGPGVRSRSITSVVDEIERLHCDYGIGHIMWLDDDLFYGDPAGLFNEIVRRNIQITWDASNGVIAAAMTSEIIAAASESGCIGLVFGFESGSSQMLREMKKPGTVSQYRRAAELIHPYSNIFSRAFLMLGFPHETLGMMMETMQLAFDLDLDWYNITILQPLPSTPIYKSMLEEGLLEDQVNPSEVRFQVGPFGKQTQTEKREREQVRRFMDEFASLDSNAVPSRDKLNLIWFYMNYKVNYERVSRVMHPIKIRMLQRFLRDIADRVTEKHALAELSAAIMEAKAGEWSEVARRLVAVDDALAGSSYWRDKFEAFNLFPQLVSLKEAVVTNRKIA